MIKISPMPQHFAVAQPTADYTCTIRADINLAVPKRVSVSSTISGGSTIAVWRQDISGKKETIKINMPTHEAKRLSNIDKLGLNEWLLRTQGRRFEVILSIEKITLKRGSNLQMVELEITFVRELI